jgi:hypothetical protein
MGRQLNAQYKQSDHSSSIFYHAALSHIYVTDGYYRSCYNHEPFVTQAVNVTRRTDPQSYAVA